MFMLCHYIKDDKKICNAPATRGAHYCRHHLELINRKMRMARKRRQLLESSARNNPLNSRQAVLKAKQRISEGIGGLGKEGTQVLASGFPCWRSSSACLNRPATVSLQPRLPPTRAGTGI